MRDPLFQIILFIIIILLSSLITIAIGRFREYLKEQKLHNFLKDFEYLEIENVKLDYSSVEALILLARAYKKEGDYEKALKIYLWINKNVKSVEILKEITALYVKAGFLEKAKTVAYQILQIRPRDKETLKTLLIIDEKLGNYKETVDIIEIFEELGVNLEKEKANAVLNYLKLGSCKEFCKEFKNIDDVYKKYPFIKREYISYLLQTNPKKAYELIDDKEIYNFFDLIFYRSDIPKKFKENGKWKITEFTPFEIKVLNYLPKDFATLEFEYVCKNCKKTFPLYSKRCPNCNELFSEEVIFNLTEQRNLKNIEL
ncbi:MULTISPECIES: tetratricopeptide repeat protein [unclassified Lebetimonas]|uniref:tetratricopeptide repeat protein n=1 Tax=unclassified Lebetimonas TaxID=2648158 RepID=UPI000464ED3B|nr:MULTISPECIES: tetratricopeptide repeat protein [unclassified Lebetimonas]